MHEHGERSIFGSGTSDSSNSRRAPATRPWFRLHAFTYLAMLMAAAAFFLLNVPGRYVTHLTIKGRQQYLHDFGLGQRIVHGWPAVYLTRDADKESFQYTRSATALWGMRERVVDLNRTLLANNIALAMFVIIAVTTLVERRRRRRNHFWQFSIGDLFACVAVFAIGFGYLVWRRHEYNHEQMAISALLEGEITEQRGNAGGTRSAGLSYVLWQSELPAFVAVLPQREWSRWFDRVVFANIPPAQLEQVQQFKRLKFLRVDELRQYCKLEDIAQLANLPELELIDITGGGVESNEVRVERGLLPNEKSDGRFTLAMTYLQSLPNLRGLYLGDTDVSDAALGVIANFPALEVLDLAGVTGTYISEAGLAHLSRTKRLRALYLKDLRYLYLSDDTVPLVTQHTDLEVLWLSSPRITDKSLVHLAKLTELRELNLSGTNITGQDVQQLAQLRRLESLVVPKAAESAAKKLQDSLPQLTVTIE